VRTVSFQGAQLTAGQRRTLEQQKRLKPAFLGDHLQQMLDDTFAKLEALKAQDAVPENPNKYSHDYSRKGTPWLGDVFGY
jgi:hypothetical protein